MLQKLTLHNFQNHKALTIPIDPLVTTIVGGSDVGKSAVVRALRWLCFNRPAGDAFIREGAKTVSVILEIDDITISRSKEPSANRYELDGQEFVAFGSDVPKDIESALHVAQLNFQNQHDGPFWLCETPGEISRQMNSIVNLSVMDDAMAYIISVVRKSIAKTEIFDDQVAAARERLESFAYLEALDDQLELLEQQQAKLDSNLQESSQMADLVKKARLAAQRVDRSARDRVATKRLLQRASKLRESASEHDKLQNLLSTAQIQRRLKAVDLSAWSGISTTWDKLNAAQTNIRQLTTTLVQAQAEKSSQAELAQEAKAANRNLQEQSEGTCPLCKQPINR